LGIVYKINIDYYSFLELTSTATSNEIKRAYRRLALKHHPDKGGDPEKFKALSEAYEILMEEETRASYDDASNHDLDTNSSNTYNDSEHHVAPISKNTMVFNTAHQPPRSQSTSIAPSNNTHHVASAGIKAEDMSPTELFNLAMTTEYVALALAKDMTQLLRLSTYDIGILSEKYASFAYQVLACPETRIILYNSTLAI